MKQIDIKVEIDPSLKESEVIIRADQRISILIYDGIPSGKQESHHHEATISIGIPKTRTKESFPML